MESPDFVTVDQVTVLGDSDTVGLFAVGAVLCFVVDGGGRWEGGLWRDLLCL